MHTLRALLKLDIGFHVGVACSSGCVDSRCAHLFFFFFFVFVFCKVGEDSLVRDKWLAAVVWVRSSWSNNYTYGTIYTPSGGELFFRSMAE
ncbi:unnamed protein product [Scytosiphon promiscuus]